MTQEKQALIDAATLDVMAARKALYASGPWLTYENAAHNLDALLGKGDRIVTVGDAEKDAPTDDEPKKRARTKSEPISDELLAEIDAKVSRLIPDSESSALTIGQLGVKTGLDTGVLSKALKRLGAKSIGNKRGTKYYIETEVAY